MKIEITKKVALRIGKVLTSKYARDVMALDEATYYRTVAKFTKFDPVLLAMVSGAGEVERANRYGAVFTGRKR